ncbi:MAG: site-specific integrase [Candidatus Krumholzibacteriia bacterium]
MEKESSLVAEYSDFLLHQQGLAEGTVRMWRHHVEPFLLHLGQQATANGLRKLSASTVCAFVVARATRLPRSGKKALCHALRSFLRYAHVRGYIDASLVEAVPTIPTYRLARLPRALPWDEVLRVLHGIDRTSLIGKRNHALLQLLVTYGLRIGEVRGLHLDDIDWRHDRLSIRHRKTRAPLLLPLTREVGDGLITYLREVRPITAPYREIFLSIRSPHRPLCTRGLAQIIRECIEHANVTGIHRGPHALRHSVASRLLQIGRPIKEIADLLGHRSLESTLAYTKIDVDHLREVALDLPGVSS